MKTHFALAIAMSTITAPFAQAGPASPEPAAPKLSVMRGKEQSIALKADAGGRLQPAANGDAGAARVTARLKVTTATPIVVKGNPTRPYLTIENGFEKPIHFRVLARDNGSTKFVEVRDISDTVEPGGNYIVKCFESGSRIEEITLTDFSIAK